MIKKINYLVLSLITLSLIFGFSSCNDGDSYSLDKMWGSIATVHVDGDGYARSFTLDNGETMFVAATATNYKPKYERVSINYTILGDNYQGYNYAIKLNGYFEDILTKPVVYVDKDDKEEQDKIGYDAVRVTSIQARASYMTIVYGVNMGGKDSHFMNLVALSEDKKQVGDEPIKLEFRHNKNKDEELYASKKANVCFKLDDYIAANFGTGLEKITFEISWKDYNGDLKTQTVTHDIPKNVAVPPIFEE